MRTKLFLLTLSIAAPISFFGQPIKEISNDCHSQFNAGLFIAMDSGFKKRATIKPCEDHNPIQVKSCWGEESLLSQRRYCENMFRSLS